MNIEKLKPWNWFKKEKEQNEDRHLLPAFGKRHYETPQLALQHLHEDIDRMFSTLMSDFGDLSSKYKWPELFNRHGVFSKSLGQDVVLRPNVDISESKKSYNIRVEIPGVDEDDIKLEIEDGTLTISGEKKVEKEEEEKGWHCIESAYGSFLRTLSLPDDVDVDNINAEFKKGVLKISLPRKEVKNAEKHTIEIKKAA